MKFWRKCATIGAAAAIAMVGAQAANATITQTIGGPGGQAFRLQCENGARLVGFRAQAGAWIDGIGLLCAGSENRVDPVGWVGGQGGSVREVYCAPGATASMLDATFTNGNGLEREYVNSLALVCAGNGDYHRACIDTGEGCSAFVDRDAPTSLGITAADLRMPDFANCPPGEVLVGLVGRADRFLHAVGAICGPQAKPAAAAAAASAMDYSDRPAIGTGPRSTAPAGSGASIGSSIGSRANRSSTVVASSISQCAPGFLWRDAGPGDQVCVDAAARDRAMMENSLANERRDPGSAYGPNGCRSGFVWREAFAGDLVCVSPEARSLARSENSLSGARRGH